MDNIKRLGYQESATLNIEPNVRALTESNLYVTGPGVLSYHNGSRDNFYVVFGTKEVLDPAKKLRSILHVSPVHERAKLYTDRNGSYYLCHASMKPGVVCHASDICLSPSGIMTNRDLENDNLEWANYDDWTPFCLETVTIPLYMYFLDQYGIEFTKKTLDHVLKQLYGRAYNDADSNVHVPNVDSDKFKDYYKLYRDLL